MKNKKETYFVLLPAFMAASGISINGHVSLGYNRYTAREPLWPSVMGAGACNMKEYASKIT